MVWARARQAGCMANGILILQLTANCDCFPRGRDSMGSYVRQIDGLRREMVRWHRRRLSKEIEPCRRTRPYSARAVDSRVE